MKLSHALTLLAVVGLIASLESSPIPLAASTPKPTLEGYSLVVVGASNTNYRDIVESAISQSVSLLIVADKPGRLEVPGLGVVDVTASPGKGTVIIVSTSLGAKVHVKDINPGFVVKASASLLRGVKGLGIYYKGAPRAGKTVDLVYIETSYKGSRVIVVSPKILQLLREKGLITKMARGGRVLWAPASPGSESIAYFHPSTLFWVAAAVADSLRSSTEPLARIALVMLGIGVGLLSLLPVMAIGVEEAPRRRGRARGKGVVSWMLRGRGS